MFNRTKFYDVPEFPRARMENYCKGKSVVRVNSSPVPEEDITKAKVVLRIDCIDEIKNLEGDKVKKQPCTDDVKYFQGKRLVDEEQREYKSRGFADILVKPARYYVCVSLENILDGKYLCKDTRDRCRFMGRYLRWAPTGIQFDIDFLTIHESVLKLEVIRHYEKGEMNVPYDEVGTSCGTKVVGRARIPLWDFLQGDLIKPVSADLLSGDKNRTKFVQLVKMDGSEPKKQGLLQVYMTVNKIIKPTNVIKPNKRSFPNVLYDNTLGLWSSFKYLLTT